MVFDGTEGGAEAGKTHNGGQHKVDGVHFHEVGNGVHASEDFYIVRGKGILHLLVFVGVGNGHSVGVEFQGLLYEQVGVAASAEHFDSEEVAVAADDIESLGANGTSGTQYGYTFHFLRLFLFLACCSFWRFSTLTRSSESARLRR